MTESGENPRKKSPDEQPATMENLIRLLGLTQEQADVVWRDMVNGKISREYGGSLHNAMKFMGAFDIDRSGRVIYICPVNAEGNRKLDTWTLNVDLWTGDYFIDRF